MSFHGRMLSGFCFLAVVLIVRGVPGIGVATANNLWYAHGTTAVLMRSPRLLAAGVDSRETYLTYRDGAVASEDREVCKAARLGPYYALVAGLDRGSDGYDALGVAAAAVRPGDGLDTLAQRIEGAVAHPLISLLSRIRTEDPGRYAQRFGGQTVLQLSLLGVEHRIPEVIILEFSESGVAQDPVNLTVRKTRCPGDCARASTTYFLGVHEAIDEFVRRSPKLAAPPSGNNVAVLIGIEQLRRPDIVGGPVAMIGMDQTGVQSVNAGACPAEILAVP